MATLGCLVFFSCSICADAQNLSLVLACAENLSVPEGRVVSTLCAKGNSYRITYERKLTQIVLMAGKRKTILQKIPAQYDPALVGSEVFIGFLPEPLQPYKKQDVLIYVSAMRSNGGGGGGQCGAGSEIHLNFLDIGGKVPKTKSRILVGSCMDSIEILDQNMSAGVMGDISVDGNNLSLHFLNYRNLEGSPVAKVAPDFTRLFFE